jgi:hypothetical protein
VLASKPWSDKLKEECFLRGPHKSEDKVLEFLMEEYVDFCEKGFWMLLPYDLVKNLELLRLSQLREVPQREQRPRVIMEYNFHGVNVDTIKSSSAEAMQFGKAIHGLQAHLFKRILSTDIVICRRWTFWMDFTKCRSAPQASQNLASASPNFLGYRKYWIFHWCCPWVAHNFPFPLLFYGNSL